MKIVTKYFHALGYVLKSRKKIIPIIITLGISSAANFANYLVTFIENNFQNNIFIFTTSFIIIIIVQLLLFSLEYIYSELNKHSPLKLLTATYSPQTMNSPYIIPLKLKNNSQLQVANQSVSIKFNSLQCPIQFTVTIDNLFPKHDATITLIFLKQQNNPEEYELKFNHPSVSPQIINANEFPINFSVNISAENQAYSLEGQIEKYMGFIKIK